VWDGVGVIAVDFRASGFVLVGVWKIDQIWALRSHANGARGEAKTFTNEEQGALVRLGSPEMIRTR
jgi:hypothetical protein